MGLTRIFPLYIAVEISLLLLRCLLLGLGFSYWLLVCTCFWFVIFRPEVAFSVSNNSKWTLLCWVEAEGFSSRNVGWTELEGFLCLSVS